MGKLALSGVMALIWGVVTWVAINIWHGATIAAGFCQTGGVRQCPA